ncbi:MAG: hypothetical protein HY294_02175 [Candidatus Rokubacteria bacterium]|nr:hypothetical protein [Candidatus Rokubacteria bacterium]MBI3824785.1 hypothetical protein [Candidatus Rokubacteria bacterium]
MDDRIDLTRRELIKLGGAAAVAGAAGLTLGAPALEAQTPKRGGTLRIRGEEPLGFDPHQTLSYRTMTNLSFVMSRLPKVKAGASIRPGTTPLESDLAESWTQPSDTTYVFKLRRGVHWHKKAPVDGRELTAEDVKYTYERFLTIKGNPNRGVLEQIDKVEAPDKYTVKLTLKEPYAWFLDNLASTSTRIVAKEAVGVELKLKGYGADIASTILGKFDKMATRLFGAWTDPDAYLYRFFMPRQVLTPAASATRSSPR